MMRNFSEVAIVNISQQHGAHKDWDGEPLT